MLVDALEDLDDEHGVGGGDGAAGLGDNVGHGHARGRADFADVEDDVARVFLERIVHGRLEVRARAVVVDAESAADIEVAHRETHLGELAVEARGLGDGRLDRDDVRHLRSDVEMHELEALLHLRGAQFLDGEKDLGGVEAELGVVAGGERPLALAARLEFYAEADHGLHAGLLRDLDDVVDLGDLLDDDDDLLAELAAEEREADVVVVFVAVADDEPLRTLVHRERDHQLGLGPGLQPVVVVLAGGDDLIDDLAELVDLDGEHAAVLALVALVLDRLGEDLVDLHDALAEEILKADDDLRLEAHAGRLVDDIHDPDRAAVGQRLDLDEAVGIDREVIRAPALETVMFFGLCGRPVGCRFGLQFAGLRGSGLGLLFETLLGLFALFNFQIPFCAMTKTLLILAQAPAAPSATSSLLQLAPLVLMFGAMYFLLIAPQRKKQKEHEKMLAALGTGDEVITTGGIYGTITSVKDDRFIIRIGENQKVEVGKAFISVVVSKSGS